MLGFPGTRIEFCERMRLRRGGFHGPVGEGVRLWLGGDCLAGGWVLGFNGTVIR